MSEIKKEKRVKQKKKLSRSAIVLIVGLIIIAIPVLIFLGILGVSALHTGTPRDGSRFEGDLDPSITAEHVSALKSEIESIGSIDSVEVICSEGQLKIYIDTNDMNEVKSFASIFLPVLEAAVNRNATQEIGIRARDTLVSYTQRLKSYLGEEERHDNVLRGKGCSVIIAEDSHLELSPMMCNVLVKPLAKADIGKTLYAGRYHLQTAGLICPPEDRNGIEELFTKCGLIRVTKPEDMSAYFPG